MICSTYLAGTMEQFQPVGKVGDKDNYNAKYISVSIGEKGQPLQGIESGYVGISVPMDGGEPFGEEAPGRFSMNGKRFILCREDQIVIPDIEALDFRMLRSCL